MNLQWIFVYMQFQVLIFYIRVSYSQNSSLMDHWDNHPLYLNYLHIILIKRRSFHSSNIFNSTHIMIRLTEACKLPNQLVGNHYFTKHKLIEVNHNYSTIKFDMVLIELLANNPLQSNHNSKKDLRYNQIKVHN